MIQVIKRDGRKVQFDKSKIESAVLKSFIAVDGETTNYAREKAKAISKYVEEKASDKELTVEEIQDLVEHGLMATKRKDVARAYITYRNERNKERTRKSELMKIVREKLFAENVQNQNANVDEKSFGGRKGEMDSAILKQFALDECMSEMSRNNHLNNEIYIHDLDSYALGLHNCLSCPFDDLLANGFKTRQTDVRPANSVGTAFQLVAVIFQIQSLQQFGGVSATHLDHTMVPYVRKSFYKHYKDGMKYIAHEEMPDELNDKLSIEDEKYKRNTAVYEYAYNMTVKETHQAVEGMYHNLSNWAA